MSNDGGWWWHTQCRGCGAQLHIQTGGSDTRPLQVHCPECKQTYTVRVRSNVAALTDESPDRSGCIAPKFRCWLNRAREYGLDKELDCSGPRAIDRYIVARLAFAIALLVVLGIGFHQFPRQPLRLGFLGRVTPIVFFVWAMPMAVVGVRCPPRESRQLTLSVLSLALLSPLVVPWAVLSPLVVPLIDRVPGYVIRLTIGWLHIGAGILLLSDMLIARIRDHVFQQPEDPQGFDPQRSLILAVINVAEAIVIFAILYSAIAILSPDSFPGRGREAMRGVLDALWFSLATMFTADIGIKYSGWARVCAAAQLFVGLFFFAGILATLTGYLTSGSIGRQRAGGGQNEGGERVEESRD